VPRVASDDADRDLLAAEYALGSLEGPERAEAERLLAGDPAFARSMAAWQQRLTPLVAHVAPVAPPDLLWQRIEAAIAPTPPATDVLTLRGRLRLWRATTTGAVVIAASLASFTLLRQPAPQRIAALSPLAGGASVPMAMTGHDGGLIVRPTAPITVPTDKDLELRALSRRETRPGSLGVLPPAGMRLAAAPAPDTQLLVSLEPKGESPTGQPTGPALLGGWLTSIELQRG